MALVDLSNAVIEYIGPRSPFNQDVGLSASNSAAATKIIVGNSIANASTMAHTGSENIRTTHLSATMPAAGTEFILGFDGTNPNAYVYKVTGVNFDQGDQLVLTFALEVPMAETT